MPVRHVGRSLAAGPGEVALLPWGVRERSQKLRHGPGDAETKFMCWLRAGPWAVQARASAERMRRRSRLMAGSRAARRACSSSFETASRTLIKEKRKVGTGTGPR